MSLLIAGTPGKPVSAYRQQYRGCLSQSVVNHPVSATHVTAQLLGCRLVADLESGRPDMDILRARELVAAQSSLAATGGPPKLAAGGRADRTAGQRGGLPLQPGAVVLSRVRWCGVVVWRFQQFQVRVTGSPRRMLPPVSTEAYTPTLTALC